jgi:hypothetical protein
MTHARSGLLFVPVLALSMLALPTLAGCSAKVEELATDPNATKSAANEAPNNHDSEEEPTVQNHDAKGAADLLAKDPSIKILDVRTPEEYAEVHLENATLVDFRAADFEQKVGELDRDATWLVHCRSRAGSMMPSSQRPRRVAEHRSRGSARALALVLLEDRALEGFSASFLGVGSPPPPARPLAASWSCLTCTSTPPPARRP